MPSPGPLSLPAASQISPGGRRSYFSLSSLLRSYSTFLPDFFSLVFTSNPVKKKKNLNRTEGLPLSLCACKEAAGVLTSP